MILINEQLLDQTTGKARLSPRGRANYNFHQQLDDPVNRLINALELDTYVRPHNHKNPDKNEIFLLLRGKVAIFTFDGNGNITTAAILDPKNGVYGGEIPPDTWHGLLVLQSGSVIYEVKEGPFTPISPENFAPFAPDPNDDQKVKAYLNYLKCYADSINTQSNEI
jgi:cupin fold WbuC family metalloprotein